MAETTGTEIIKRDTLSAFATPREAMDFFAGLGFDVADNEADGIYSIPIEKDKSRLVDVPFLILEWRFSKSKHDEDEVFASLEIMLEDGTRRIINDGSEGIRRQLQALTAHRIEKGHPAPQHGRMVRGGLNRSDYEYINPETKKKASATTYYLNY